MADLDRAIEEVRPDVLLIDTNTYGAAVAAQRSGLPWAITLPSLVPLPGSLIPPYGLGMAPMSGPLGWLRDRLLWKVVERVYGKAMLPRLNQMRTGVGLPALRSPLDHFRSADRLIVLTGEPLEYPRTDLPPSVRLVGAQLWDPPAATPDWLLEPGDPWVLVTCSTDYQGDEALAIAAVEALKDEPVRVVLTLGRRVRRCSAERVKRAGGAVYPARCGARAGRGRGVPRRHGDCGKGGGGWSADRRSAVRARPARGFAADRRSRCGRGPAREAADARAAARDGASRDGDALGRAASSKAPGCLRWTHCVRRRRGGALLGRLAASVTLGRIP